LPKTAFRVTRFLFRVGIPLSIGCGLFVLVLLVMPREARHDLRQANILTTHQDLPDNATVPITFIRFDDHEATRNPFRQVFL
jgi:hypothetical protein